MLMIAINPATLLQVQPIDDGVYSMYLDGVFLGQLTASAEGKRLIKYRTDTEVKTKRKRA